jgi:hypothetical protein
LSKISDGGGVCGAARLLRLQPNANRGNTSSSGNPRGKFKDSKLNFAPKDSIDVFLRGSRYENCYGSEDFFNDLANR